MKPLINQNSDAQQLERIVSLLNAVIESTADGVLVVDRAGKIVHFNRKFVSMWGIPESILTMRDDDRAIGFVREQLKQPEKFVNEIRSLYTNAEAVDFATLEFKDGRTFERYSQPQKLGGEIVGRVWSFRDITRRVINERAIVALLENERAARGRAEEAARIRDELVAMVSHDLKNPLSSILASVHLLQKETICDERMKQPLAIIQRSADHMHRMVLQLLDAYRTEVGGYRKAVEAGQSRCDSGSIIRNAVEMQQIIASGRGVQLLMDVPEKLPAISVHEGLLLQVFQNLIGNGLKFTPRGGVVRVKADAAERDLVFSVEDSGPGVEESLFPTLFDRFAQAKKTAQLGTGLGLAIAKGIVEAHHGQIWAKNKVGAGATFFFSIPIHP